MTPYFENHSAGGLFVLALVCLFGGEFVQLLRQLRWRNDATRVGPSSFWVGVGVWVVVATVILHRAGSYWPGATIGDGAFVFGIGMVLLAAGVGLRWSSFWALGQYFTFTVEVSPEQQIITAGPYRLLRHPGYAGGLLAMIGIGVIYSNWIGLAVISLSSLAITVWRIHIEEAALLGTAGDPYRHYAEHHKRLMPLIW